MNSVTHKFPAQQLPLSAKGKKWRKECVDFACDHTFLTNANNRKSTYNKKINYDLVNGIIHMDDIENVLNPTKLRNDLIPETIQHYPIINSKLNLLSGEEKKRLFDYRVIITDPTSISEASKRKADEVLRDLQQLIEATSETDEQYAQKLEELSQYYTYTWQDYREARSNKLLNQYNKENDFSTLFNDGFKDACAVGEECYICEIVSGEPTLEKLDPRIMTVIRSSNSNRIEDADMIILKDYWSPGKIIDTYYDSLTDADRKYIENISEQSVVGSTDEMGNWKEDTLVPVWEQGNMTNEEYIAKIFGRVEDISASQTYDAEGNIRVVRVFWKSRRKIKKVTSYDPMTGEEVINFYPETYVPNKTMGEKEEVLWINEAWEGTKIGEKVYVNVRPRPIQYNRLSNPSRCHFGIIGSIYATNGDKPYSLVDMMKPYNYLYDVVHDRLNRAIAQNYGRLAKLDLAMIPDGWKIEKWLYFARKDKLAIIDSFNEGKKGTATGKLAGSLNNASNGVVDLEDINIIQQYINILELIKMEMSEVVGVTKQREGQVSNRETVGGVERATLQSSHITEWIFTRHENLKKRVLECFVETAKIAMKGRNKKFQYILPDFAQQLVEIDGDEFAEADYGIVVDSSQETQALSQKMEGMVQAALQNQMITFSTALKMFTSCSMAEKMRMIEKNEQELQQRQQQAQQQQLQVQQQEAQLRAQTEQQKLEMENLLNERDNDTKLTIAAMQAEKDEDYTPDETNKEALLEKMREFDLKIQLDRDRLEFDKNKANEDRKVKREQIHSKSKTSTQK